MVIDRAGTGSIGYFYSEDGINWVWEKVGGEIMSLGPTVITGFGNVYVVWAWSYNGALQGLFMRVRDSTGKWSDIEQVPVARGAGYAPYAPHFRKFNGEIYMIWREMETRGNNEMFISRMKGDRVWDKKVNLTNTPNSSNAFSFIVRNGIVYITWWDVIDYWQECDIFYDEVPY